MTDAAVNSEAKVPAVVPEESLSGDSNDKSSVNGGSGSSSSASTRSRSRKSAHPMSISSSSSSSTSSVPKTSTAVSQSEAPPPPVVAIPEETAAKPQQRVTRKSLSSQSSVGKETAAAPVVPVPAVAVPVTTAATSTLNRKRKLSKPTESAVQLEEKKIKAEKLQELEIAAAAAVAAAEATPVQQPAPPAVAVNEQRGPVKRKASVKANESIVKPTAPPPQPKSPAKASAAAGDKKKGAKKPPTDVAVVKQEMLMKAPAEVPVPPAPMPKQTAKRTQPKKSAKTTETKLNISSCDVDENTRDCFSDTDKVKPKAAAQEKKGKSESTVDTVDDMSSRGEEESSSASALHFSSKKIPEAAKNANSQQLEEGDEEGSQSQSQEELKNDVGDLSQQSGTEPKKQRKKRRGSTFDLEHAHRANLPASELFVYKWPQDEANAESYVLQEQVSEFLHVKSFKRKYPDIFRRFIDIKEREYLKENQVVTEVQCDLGLTALRLSDCLDLMADEYPEKYNELNNFLIEKRRKMLAAQAALQSSQILAKRKAEAQMMRANRANMSEEDRLKETMRKAMYSASTFNAQLQREKKEERNAFFDLQTFRIQKPAVHELKKHKMSPETYEKNKTKLLNQNTKGPYPVSLLPGQFQSYYRVYRCEELRRLPLNTVLQNPMTAPAYLYNEWRPCDEELKLLEEYQLSKANEDAEIEQQHELLGPTTAKVHVVTTTPLVNGSASSAAAAGGRSSAATTPAAIPTTPLSATTGSAVGHSHRILPASGIKIAPSTPQTAPSLKLCYICQKPGQVSQSQDAMISCSACPRSAHPTCLELNASLVNWPCIRQYQWQCMECKKCSTCNQPHDEDKMLFCDRCDRGFHTYCVGVASVPSGSWLCKPCAQVTGNTPNGPNGSPTKVVRGRGRPPGSLNKPKDPNSPKKSSKPNKPKKLNMIFDELKTVNRIDVDYDHTNTSFGDDEETMDE